MSASAYIPPIDQQADTGGIPPEFRARLGENLSDRRRRRGLSLDRVATLAEVTPDELAAIECGEGDIPHIDTLVRLAAALDAGPNELLAGIEWAAEAGTWRISRP